MIDSAEKASRSFNASLRLSGERKGTLAVAAALRALTWAVLYVGDQLKRQADFWTQDS